MSQGATPPKPTSVDSQAIRPFRVEVPRTEIDELRRRLHATRWPEKETVADQSQGVQLASIRELARYWGTDYDFRRFEARLNALPQFMTEIDGLDIHYQAPRSWTEQAYPNLIYFNEVGKGNHFAAWQEPELFSQELRAAFRPLRKAH